MMYKIVATVECEDGGIASPVTASIDDGSLSVNCMADAALAFKAMELVMQLRSVWEEHEERSGWPCRARVTADLASKVPQVVLMDPRDL